MTALPPLLGALHETVAVPSPGVAVTPVGAAGAVAELGFGPTNTTVAIAQVVLAPVLTLAFGVAPADGSA